MPNEKAKPKPVVRYVEKKLTEDDEAKIIEKYFGCHPKYIRVRGTSVTIDATGIAYDGGTLNTGLLEKRSQV